MRNFSNVLDRCDNTYVRYWNVKKHMVVSRLLGAMQMNMGVNKCVVLFLVLIHSSLCAQEPVKFTVEEKNNTGRDLLVYKTAYYSDSTRVHSFIQFSKNVSGGFVSEHSYIRIDYVALDKASQDTICRISAFREDLEKGLISLEVGMNSLKPPFKIQPRLRITGADYQSLLKTGDPIEIKLMSNKKVAGKIFNYDKNKITIVDEANGKTEILATDIKGIRCCGYLFAYGAGITILKNCKYRKIENVSFDLVEQKMNSKKQFWGWVEVE